MPKVEIRNKLKVDVRSEMWDTKVQKNRESHIPHQLLRTSDLLLTMLSVYAVVKTTIFTYAIVRLLFSTSVVSKECATKLVTSSL